MPPGRSHRQIGRRAQGLASLAGAAQAADSAEEDGAKRYRLWELEPGSHCSVICTCLTIEDLRRIVRKADLTIEPDAQDCDIHGYFVTRASVRSTVSKLLQKTLDRRYASQIARFRRAKSPEELWELWREAMSRGAVAGVYGPGGNRFGDFWQLGLIVMAWTLIVTVVVIPLYWKF